ncbi:MAG: gluconate 2-dehydrogenase subunit 3 family protein [Verrucomicrobiaceae bacterium]|nr:gluconate 2-dehydrogenase subunit 3 family protein [Verrucomicrobiaceae bacterium]
MTEEQTTTLRLDRRQVLKWFATAAASTQLSEFGFATAPPVITAKGYGTDPDLMKIYKPGDFWPLTFTADQRETVSALADVIFPEDHLGPAASTLRVPDYMDEWISAPYPVQAKDRDALLPGLQWLEQEANKRFQVKFAALSEAQKHAICDDICGAPPVKAEFKKGAAFFSKFRSLAASAYYGTDAGWKALGYVGNISLASFDGPPPEVLALLGVEQTVK